MARRGLDPIDEFERGEDDWSDDGDDDRDDPLEADQDEDPDETLATETCSNCGRLVIADAVRCPFCGEHAPGTGRRPVNGWIRWTAIAIVGLFLVGIVWQLVG